MTTQEQIIGRGMIKVGGGSAIFGGNQGSMSGEFIREFKNLDLTLTNTQGELKDKGVLDTIHKKLLLPADYTILGLYFQPWSTFTWFIVVEHPDIPLLEEGRMLPEVRPVYQRLDDGTTVLSAIDIET